jgi:predicted AAA+ superfamily ATPase
MIFSLVAKEVIFDYLSKEDTDYAILINGPWGSGKTYYWKNNLSKKS